MLSKNSEYSYEFVCIELGDHTTDPQGDGAPEPNPWWGVFKEGQAYQNLNWVCGVGLFKNHVLWFTWGKGEYLLS